jgi:hypothetical protein
MHYFLECLESPQCLFIQRFKPALPREKPAKKKPTKERQPLKTLEEILEEENKSGGEEGI